MKTFIKVILFLLISIFLLLISAISIIDRTPYQEMAYYEEWKEIINSYDVTLRDDSDSLKVGWAKVNITPQNPTPLAGYGKRKGAHYEAVHDSVFVRTIFLEKNNTKIALVSGDLLIIPPSVTKLVEAEADEIGIPLDRIYFGATHSHNSLGAWFDTLVGKLFAGPYDDRVEKLIAKGIISSIKEASKNLNNANVSFEKDYDSKDIKNRLIPDGVIEPYIRSVSFKTKTGKAILTTYAAHSTVLNAATLELSRDFPGVLIDSLEQNHVDFAMYMSGTVGSMGPIEFGETDFIEVNNQAKGVLEELLSDNEYESSEVNPNISAFTLKLPLRKPSPKISKNLALRPWLFKRLFGDSPNFVKVAKIGNILLIGLPCDFSGELMKPLDEYASSKGLNLIITSFNGTYAGYITDDRHFDLDAYETLTMNWFGPYNGAYFSEMVKDIIDKVIVDS